MHDEITIDPLGLFPIRGLRCVDGDTVLEINKLDVADCFRDLVCWAWEDGSTQEHGVGTTFLTALDCDKVDLDAPGSESLEPPLEVRDMRHATTTTEGTEGTVGQVEDQAFCTCEADQAEDQADQTEDQTDDQTEDQVDQTEDQVDQVDQVDQADDQADQADDQVDQADQVDLSDYGVSSAEYPHGRADSIPQMHAFDRPERVQLTTSSSSTDSS